MSVVPPPQPGANRSQGPWDRRSVAELSQTSFRTTLRGFDPGEVRAILESVAADYRVLQLQNASLQRQLADLEAVLQSYQQSGSPESGTSLAARQELQQASEEARAILMRAHAQAEETMARVSALTRNAERPMEKLEHDQRNFRVLLASTVSEMLAILGATEQNPYDVDHRQYAPSPLLLEAAVSQPPVTVEAEPAPPSIEPHAATIEPDNSATVAPEMPVPFTQQESAAPPPHEDLKLGHEHDSEPEESQHDSQTRTPVPLGFIPRGVTRRSLFAVDAVPETPAADPMLAVLKELDKAMVEIPALPGE